MSVTVITTAVDLIVIDAASRWTVTPKNVENVLAEINDKIQSPLITRNCLASVNPYDWVYSSGPNAVAKANATNNTKMPVLGVVISKPSSTSALVLKGVGTIIGWPIVLVSQAFYWMGLVDGLMIPTPPPGSSGNVIQRLAQAASTNVLDVMILPDEDVL